MQVRDVMTETLATVDPTAPLGEAARIMRDQNVGTLPVQRAGGTDVEGLLTDRDIVVRSVAMRLDPEITPVEDVMTKEIVFCYYDEDIASAAKSMQERNVGRVLVFERETDQLKGIVSLADLAVRSEDPEISAQVLHDIAERRRAA
ncbi:MAG: CBS domain-containing protein [Dehalococcoidia bacterium]